MKTSISIIAQSSISTLGKCPDEIWNSYLNDSTYISEELINEEIVNVAKLPKNIKNEIELLKVSDSKYQFLDNSVLYTILVARNAVKNAGWTEKDVFGINIGSSRGATALFEEYHEEFLKTNLEAVKTILDIVNTTTEEFKDIPSIDRMIANRYEQEIEDVQEWLGLTEWSQSNISKETINKVQDELFALNIIPEKWKFEDLVYQF